MLQETKTLSLLFLYNNLANTLFSSGLCTYNAHFSFQAEMIKKHIMLVYATVFFLPGDKAMIETTPSQQKKMIL